MTATAHTGVRGRGAVARRLAAAAAAAAAVGLAACSGGDGGDRGSRTGPAPAATLPPAHGPGSDVAPDAAAVARRWADALRRGDVAAAASLFALPAIVGSPRRQVRVTTRAAVVRFHRAQPCGATLVATRPAAHGFLLATFRLTERPGGGRCGGAAGRLATAALRVEHGRIAWWIRVAAPPPADATPA